MGNLKRAGFEVLSFASLAYLAILGAINGFKVIFSVFSF